MRADVYLLVHFHSSDLKFGTRLGFAKAHHKIIPIEKNGHGLGLGKLPKILWFHFDIYTMVEDKLVHSLG